MRIACPTCRAEYKIDEGRVPASGLNVRCPKCRGTFPVRPPAPAPAAPVPLPAATPPVAPPPFASAATRQPFGPDDGPSVPLPPPQHGAPLPPWEEEAPRAGLGGPTATFAPPASLAADLPFDAPSGADEPSGDPFEQTAAAAAPMGATLHMPPPPGLDAAPPGATLSMPPPPGFGEGSLPPGATLQMAPPPGLDADAPEVTADFVDPPWSHAAEEAAVEAAAWDDPPPEPATWSPPPPPAPAAPLAPPDEPALTAQMRPLGFGEVDFSGVLDDDPPARPAPPPAPAPEVASAGAVLGNVTEGFPFDDHPAPASPAPAPEPAAALGSLGALGPRETEELEALFDEGAAKRPAAAPPRAAPSPAPPRAATAATFKVRRSSGKVFGPFTEPEVVSMLRRGDLLGNEEVSSDGGAAWSAIGSVASFGEAIRKLMDTPAPGGDRAVPVIEASAPAARKVRGPGVGARLGSAGAALVAGLRRRVALLVAVGAVLLLLAAGLAGGLTRYGVFFYRLVPGGAAVSSGAGAKLLRQARAALGEDDYASVKDAAELADRALRLEPNDPAAKAVALRAAALLQRRHGGGAQAFARARAWVPELTGRAEKDAGAAAAVLEASLVPGQAPSPAVEELLRRHVAKDGRDGDALLALGDAALARGDLGQAAALYDRLDALAPGAARTSHARGLVAARRGDAAGARKLFEAALARNGRHLGSAVELAAVALGASDLAAADAAAGRVLAPEAKGLAGPLERARARTLRAAVLARRSGDDPLAAVKAAEAELQAALQEDAGAVEPRLALASLELDRGAPGEAAAALAPVLASPSAGARVTALQARALAGQGRVLDATTTLDAALGRQPGDLGLLLAKGSVLWTSGKRLDAEKAWADAVARSPDAWEPHLALAHAALERGDAAAAAKEVELAVARAPREAQVLTAKGDVALASGDLAGAEGSYVRALAAEPARAEAHLGLARVALARGDQEAARARLEKTLALQPRLAAAQATYGEVLWRAKDLAGARKALQAAVALDPGHARARGALGAVELDLGELDAALADLLAATNLDERSAQLRAWYGNALLARGDLPPAIEQLRRAIDLDPRNPRHQLALGAALERAGTVGEAEDAYRAAQGLAPGQPEPLEALANLYMAVNRCGDALPLLHKAAVLAPAEARIRVAVADCTLKQGHPDEAVQLYRNVLAGAPKMVALYYKIARAEHAAGRRGAALPWYERAAREDTANPMPHYYLGFAYKDRGERARAVAEFKAYLKARPDADDARDIQREIEDLGG